MTDYAPAAAEQSWNWWMTTAAAAMRMQNFRNHQGSDQEDEFAGPERKRQRIGGDGHDPYWTAASFDRDDPAAVAAGPLDLSVKATLTTTTTAHMMDGQPGGRDEYTATTPVKKSAGANGRSSKKTGGKTAGSGTTAAAVKAVTRKLMPQLVLDNRMDRSSPVSGTIIVPVPSEDSLSEQPSSPHAPSSYTTTTTTTNTTDGGYDDDDYDGGDIDPEYNVVVATDEARRRLESIPNVLGPYRCRLCGVRYTDAFALARHRCRCIVHVRYQCPECDKVFQCPANLASHRRWHGTAGSTKTSGGGGAGNNRISKNGAGDNDVKPEMTAAPVQHAPTVTTHVSGDGNVVANDATTVTATASAAAITAAAGFKKNMLQRAVQAAAAAANNNNNDIA